MQSHELRDIRRRLGLSRLQMARMIGYTGTDRNDEMRIRKMETRDRPPLHIARLVWLIGEIKREPRNFRGELTYLDPDGNVIWPDWPGYDFSHEPDPQHQKERADGPA